MKNVYRLLCCATCLKLSTASKHYNLLSKLHLLGMSASALAWFKSYLSLRKQVVRIGSDLSDPSHWQWVWARGPFSVQLFTLYFNDLLSVPKKCETMGYVGDTKLLLALPPFDISVAISDFNGDLRENAKWYSTSSLLINPNKTKLPVVGVPQLTRNVSLPPVVLLGKNIKLLPVKRFGDLDRLCRNFRRSYISKLSSSCLYNLRCINWIKHPFGQQSSYFNYQCSYF